VVVDEYGDVQGILTLKDILEDIVGEFEEEDDIDPLDDDIERAEDGAYLVDGRMPLRELNREINAELPLDGPKTISGFIIAYLDGMPKHACCIHTHGLKIELIEFNNLAIQKVKIYPF
jgi:Mg2+/Co2+ transporter CorB